MLLDEAGSKSAIAPNVFRFFVLHLTGNVDQFVRDITLLEVLVKNVVKVSFAGDIRPLFRSVDIEHMKRFDILLDDYKYMSDATNQYGNAQRVYDSLTGKKMPPNGPYWAKDKLDLFENWIKGGCQP